MPKTVVSDGGDQRADLSLPKMSVVTMDAVPDPPVNARRDKYGVLWTQIGELKPGRALRAVFGSEKQAKYVRSSLRKRAKAEGLFLSSSHETDLVTWYFWIEKTL